MSEIAKLLSAAGLLSAGFFGASLFGPPASTATPTSEGDWAPQRLQPIDAAPVPSGTFANQGSPSALDTSVAPAGHWEEQGVASAPTTHEVARPNVPATDNSLPFSIPPLAAAPDNIARATPAPTPPAAAPTNAPSDDRLASLEPPPLLESTMFAVPLKRTSFPTQQPIATQTPQPNTSPAPADAGTTVAANGGPVANPWNNPSPPSTGITLPPQASNSWNAPSLTAPVANQSWDDDEPIYHVVSDGDSLAKLAERYLGDAGRARDIYELNRDVVEHPDLLRIGAKLRIPERLPAAQQVNVFDASGTAAASYAPQSRLVPLPELPSDVRAAPRARLQAPISATFSGG
ncbi:LysM peptidoglycan-binding domain-containing protein [Aeoliella mucimassa]|uniref:LysM domain/BON superfamily protein n=1 Tax=Aeoliella mucimassa TaxID=2527972 RepID=A0A518AKI3_9BACT|nr:LysM peptidoglycan-binding domain-containing protein [Aeoliella mucimassa]QDU55247.1 LysM domain/BON superfamily protein [Aeoliella mucimassa]